MSTLNTITGKPVAASEFIQPHWAWELRYAYRRLRQEGVRRSTARSIIHGAYHVGLNAGREEAHQQRLAEIRNRSAA